MCEKITLVTILQEVTLPNYELVQHVNPMHVV